MCSLVGSQIWTKFVCKQIHQVGSAMYVWTCFPFLVDYFAKANVKVMVFLTWSLLRIAHKFCINVGVSFSRRPSAQDPFAFQVESRASCQQEGCKASLLKSFLVGACGLRRILVATPFRVAGHWRQLYKRSWIRASTHCKIQILFWTLLGWGTKITALTIEDCVVWKLLRWSADATFMWKLMFIICLKLPNTFNMEEQSIQLLSKHWNDLLHTMTLNAMVKILLFDGGKRLALKWEPS